MKATKGKLIKRKNRTNKTKPIRHRLKHLIITLNADGLNKPI